MVPKGLYFWFIKVSKHHKKLREIRRIFLTADLHNKLLQAFCYVTIFLKKSQHLFKTKVFKKKF